jgi:hypothetical protein
MAEMLYTVVEGVHAGDAVALLGARVHAMLTTRASLHNLHDPLKV